MRRRIDIWDVLTWSIGLLACCLYCYIIYENGVDMIQLYNDFGK